MGLFDKWGKDKPAAQPQSADDQAIERYRYMLRTAPPEAIEQAHAEAFAQLTPEQRRMALQKMVESVPAAERASLERVGADPQALARVATRAEIRQPGAMERMFGQPGGGLGGIVASSMLGSLAGTVLGSVIAREFFANDNHRPDGFASTAEPTQDESHTDADYTVDDGDDNFDDTFEV